MEANWDGLKTLLSSGDINTFEWSQLVNTHLGYFEQKISIYQELAAIQLQLEFLTEKN